MKPERQFRFDWAWPEYKIAIEYEGIYHTKKSQGGSGKSRHTTITGFREDCIKYNEASLRGWIVLRFTNDMMLLRNFKCLPMLTRAFNVRAEELKTHRTVEDE